MCPQRSEEGVRCLGAGVTDDYELPSACWELNMGLLEEQSVPLATEPSLQLLSFLFLLKESWRESTEPLTETKGRIWATRPRPSGVRLLHSASDHTAALSAMRSGAANEGKDAFD